MSIQVYGKQIAIAPTADTLNGTGNSLTFIAATPGDVVRWGYVLTSALTVGSFAATLSTGVTGTLVVKQTMTGSGTRANGDVIYVDAILPVAAAAGEDSLFPGNPNMPRSVINFEPAGPVRFKAGQVVSIDVTVAAGSAGTGFAFIEYVPYDKEGSEPQVVKFTGTP